MRRRYYLLAAAAWLLLIVGAWYALTSDRSTTYEPPVPACVEREIGC